MGGAKIGPPPPSRLEPIPAEKGTHTTTLWHLGWQALAGPPPPPNEPGQNVESRPPYSGIIGAVDGDRRGGVAGRS